MEKLEPKDLQLIGIKKLEFKKNNKIPGQVIFHIDDKGKVSKIEIKDYIK